MQRALYHEQDDLNAGLSGTMSTSRCFARCPVPRCGKKLRLDVLREAGRFEDVAVLGSTLDFVWSIGGW